MAIYRIHITLADGSRNRYTGLYADGTAAVLKTLDDFPGARSIAALFVRRQAA